MRGGGDNPLLGVGSDAWRTSLEVTKPEEIGCARFSILFKFEERGIVIPPPNQLGGGMHGLPNARQRVPGWARMGLLRR